MVCKREIYTRRQYRPQTSGHTVSVQAPRRSYCCYLSCYSHEILNVQTELQSSVSQDQIDYVFLYPNFLCYSVHEGTKITARITTYTWYANSLNSTAVGLFSTSQGLLHDTPCMYTEEILKATCIQCVFFCYMFSTS